MGPECQNAQFFKMTKRLSHSAKKVAALAILRTELSNSTGLFLQHRHFSIPLSLFTAVMGITP